MVVAVLSFTLWFNRARALPEAKVLWGQRMARLRDGYYCLRDGVAFDSRTMGAPQVFVQACFAQAPVASTSTKALTPSGTVSNQKHGQAASSEVQASAYAAQIDRLARLRDEGILTAEEFEAKKAQIQQRS
jgi:hypothetical protein